MHPDDYADETAAAGPYSWQRETHAEARLLGLGCPFDCAACDPNAGLDFDPADEATHEVQTATGPVYAYDAAEAAAIARAEAQVTGRAVRVIRVGAPA